MKALLVILVLAGAGFAFWKFQDQIFAAVEGADDGDNSGVTVTVDGERVDGPGGGGSGDNNNNPGGGGDGADNNEIARAYPMPTFKPIEELVGNWQSVPATAFPRRITISAPVKYPLAGGRGSTTNKAGSAALALSLNSSKLLIAPRVGSTLRAQIDIDQTDFKAKLGEAYESYKQRKRAQVRKQRERAALVGVAPPAPVAASGKTTSARDRKPAAAKLKEYVAKAGPMPTRSADGTVPLMVKSIKDGDVTEIKLGEISHWGPIVFEEVEGNPYWTASVNYETTSLFGTLPTEAMALMKNGQVVEWRYTGSLEEVP